MKGLMEVNSIQFQTMKINNNWIKIWYIIKKMYKVYFIHKMNNKEMINLSRAKNIKLKMKILASKIDTTK